MSIQNRMAVSVAFEHFKHRNRIEFISSSVSDIFLAGCATVAWKFIIDGLAFPLGYQIRISFLIILYCIIGIGWCHAYTVYHKANHYANTKIKQPVIFRQDVKFINYYHIHLHLPHEQ